MPDYGEFQINGQATGASAATAVITQEVTEPFEVNSVAATSSAATSTAVAVDVQKNGTSIYLTPIGTVFQGSTAQSSSGGLTAAATSFDFSPAGNPVEAGTTITIDTEAMLVTKVDGSPTQSPSGVGVQRLTVTRAANGTVAAVHAAGANVLNTKATIASGGTATPAGGSQLAVTVPFARGDILTVIGATGATNLGVSLTAVNV